MKHLPFALVAALLCLTTMANGQHTWDFPTFDNADSGGEKLVRCYHSGDTHVTTSANINQSAVSLQEIGCILEVAPDEDGKVFTGSSFKYGSVTTTYRGQILHQVYTMNVDLYMKFSCSKLPNKKAVVHQYNVAVVTSDGFPPDSCLYDTWGLTK